MNVTKRAREFFHHDEVAWEELGGGLSQRVLSGHAELLDYTRVLRFAPGTVTADVQRHDFWEEVFIVSGSFTDLSLDETFTAGMYACRPPGMPHGPWRSDEGCLLFEVRYPARGGADR